MLSKGSRFTAFNLPHGVDPARPRPDDIEENEVVGMGMLLE
jgi:hypothetical protein